MNKHPRVIAQFILQQEVKSQKPWTGQVPTLPELGSTTPKMCLLGMTWTSRGGTHRVTSQRMTLSMVPLNRCREWNALRAPKTPVHARRSDTGPYVQGLDRWLCG